MVEVNTVFSPHADELTIVVWEVVGVVAVIRNERGSVDKGDVGAFPRLLPDNPVDEEKSLRLVGVPRDRQPHPDKQPTFDSDFVHETRDPASVLADPGVLSETVELDAIRKTGHVAVVIVGTEGQNRHYGLTLLELPADVLEPVEDVGTRKPSSKPTVEIADRLDCLVSLRLAAHMYAGIITSESPETQIVSLSSGVNAGLGGGAGSVGGSIVGAACCPVSGNSPGLGEAGSGSGGWVGASACGDSAALPRSAFDCPLGLAALGTVSMVVPSEPTASAVSASPAKVTVVSIVSSSPRPIAAFSSCRGRSR